jgi:3-oxoacyl-[acyl-carrier protein] reductase
MGAAIAGRLGRAGAKVAITYRSSRQAAERLAGQLRAEGHEALAMAADSGSAAEISGAFAGIAERFGGIDILVNNAGLAHPGRIEDYDPARFDEMVAVNIKGVFVATREALAHMKRGGRVINIGSVSSDYVPYPGNAVYAMTKSAVDGLTRGLARELGGRGITINNVQPGRIDTRMLRDALAERFGQVRETMPLGRYGEADEVASLVEYLCGDQAGFITGATLRIDGGVSV